MNSLRRTRRDEEKENKKKKSKKKSKKYQCCIAAIKWGFCQNALQEFWDKLYQSFYDVLQFNSMWSFQEIIAVWSLLHIDLIYLRPTFSDNLENIISGINIFFYF